MASKLALYQFSSCIFALFHYMSPSFHSCNCIGLFVSILDSFLNFSAWLDSHSFHGVSSGMDPRYLYSFSCVVSFAAQSVLLIFSNIDTKDINRPSCQFLLLRAHGGRDHSPMPCFLDFLAYTPSYPKEKSLWNWSSSCGVGGLANDVGFVKCCRSFTIALSSHLQCLWKSFFFFNYFIV